jgi:hypothetical protein
MNILSGLLVGVAFTSLYIYGPITGVVIFSLALVCACLSEEL